MASQYLTDKFSLEGHTAVVVGGTGGIGSELLIGLVRAGVSTIISLEMPNDPLSATLQAKVAEAGQRLLKFECDLADSSTIRTAFASIEAAGLLPDILVNCGGVMRRNPCEKATDADLDLLLNVNVKAGYILMQEFGRRLLDAGKPGKIVNIASVTSFLAGFNTSVYASTKGAVLQMTKAFSNEWSVKGIQVNCIAPGFIKTPMTAAYHDDEKMTDYLMARVPMARWGTPEDLVAACLFLTAPSNTFTSGACIVVDGGFCGK